MNQLVEKCGEGGGGEGAVTFSQHKLRLPFKYELRSSEQFSENLISCTDSVLSAIQMLIRS